MQAKYSKSLLPPLFILLSARPQHLLQPLQAVDGQPVSGAGLQEAPSVAPQGGTGREQACAEPHQLPPTLHAQPERVQEDSKMTGHVGA